MFTNRGQEKLQREVEELGERVSLLQEENRRLRQRMDEETASARAEMERMAADMRELRSALKEALTLVAERESAPLAGRECPEPFSSRELRAERESLKRLQADWVEEARRLTVRDADVKYPDTASLEGEIHRLRELLEMFANLPASSDAVPAPFGGGVGKTGMATFRDEVLEALRKNDAEFRNLREALLDLKRDIAAKLSYAVSRLKT